MREIMFISILLGGAAYTVVILYGLFSRYSLSWIFSRGVIALILTSFLTLFLLKIVKIMADNENNSEQFGSEDINKLEGNDNLKDKNSQKSEEINGSEQENSVEQEENFSPINPPEFESKEE